MFVIENYLETRRKKIQAWEDARERWVNSGEYRYKNEYERIVEPYPVIRWSKVGSVALPIIGSLIVTGLLAGLVFTEAQSEEPKKEETVQTNKNCQAFNKEDKVRIQYGDYKGNNGTIIGGCEKDQSYQVKLDDKQYANLSGDNISDPVDVSNKVISVDNKDNLVTIEVPEKKE